MRRRVGPRRRTGSGQEPDLLAPPIQRTAGLVVLAFEGEQAVHLGLIAPELRVGLLGLGVGDLILELLLLEREEAFVDGVDDPVARQLGRIRTRSRVESDREGPRLRVEALEEPAAVERDGVGVDAGLAAEPPHLEDRPVELSCHRRRQCQVAGIE